MKKKEGVALLAEGVRLLAEYQARLAAQDTWGVLVVLQALDAAGKDGTIRHVMSGVNPQGVRVAQLQGSLGRGARPRLPVAVREAAARARRDRDLQPLALRGGARGPGPPREPRPPEAPAAARSRRHLEAALPRDQRVGALPDRQRLPDREALPEHLARRSSAPASCGGSTCRTTTGSSPLPTSASVRAGTITRPPSPRCFRTRARSGRLGT